MAPGTPIVLTFGMNDPYYHLNYYLRINSGTNIPVTSPYTFTPTATGAYTLVLIGDERERCTLFDTIVVTVDCPTCATTGISAISPACVGNPSHFINNVGNCSGLGTGATNDLVYTWDYGDGTTAVGFAPDHTYTAAGTYTVKMTYQYVSPDNDGRDCPIKTGGTTTVVVTPCQPPPCEDCIGSFAPTPGDYIIGTWVKQAGGQNLTTYLNAGIKITCHSSFGDVVSGPFFPKSTGKIIDGWQRIEEKITVPLATSQIKIQLLNTGTTDAFFDDIRIHPVDGNMKTYVYDPISLRLMAELDENNYATFYEYDEEGALIRVKKETERGIMTIKENRNNNSKK